MQWHSVSEFFAMGGYAPYVWGSVGACALAMLVEPWALAARHRRLVGTLRKRRHVAPAAPVRANVVALRRPAA